MIPEGLSGAVRLVHLWFANKSKGKQFDLLMLFADLLNVGVSTRVSNLLGGGRPRAARLAGTVVLWMTMTETVVVALILVLIRNIWGYAYSNEMEVITFLTAMMPLLAVTNILDGLTCVLSGTSPSLPAITCLNPFIFTQ